MANIPGFNQKFERPEEPNPTDPTRERGEATDPTRERDEATDPTRERDESTDPTRVNDAAVATDLTAIRINPHQLRLGFNYYVHQKYLKHLKPCHVMRPIQLDSGEPGTVRLGRDYQNPAIDIYLVDMYLSRHMADIFIRNGQFCIRNNSATAKFVVDSIELKQNDVAEIWHRSRIRFGGLKFGEDHGLNYIEFICDVKLDESSYVDQFVVELFSDERAPLYRSVRRYIHSRAPWATRHNTDPPDPEFEEPFHTHMRIIEARRKAGMRWRNLDIDLIPKNPRNLSETRQPLVTNAPYYLWDFEEDPPPPDEHEDPQFPRNPQQYYASAQIARERYARRNGTPIPPSSSTAQQPFYFPTPTTGRRDDYAYTYGESGSELSMLYNRMSNLGASMRPGTNGRQTHSMNWDQGRQMPGILRNMHGDSRTRPNMDMFSPNMDMFSPNMDMFSSMPQNQTQSQHPTQPTWSMPPPSVPPGGTERQPIPPGPYQPVRPTRSQTNQSELPSLPPRTAVPRVNAMANTSFDLIPFNQIFEADSSSLIEGATGSLGMDSHDSGMGSEEPAVTNPNLPISNRNDTETK